MMKKIMKAATIIFSTSLLLIACGDGANPNEDNINTTESLINNQQNNIEENNSDSEQGNNMENTLNSEESEIATNNSNENPTNNNDNDDFNHLSDNKAGNKLSQFSHIEIEYARVWLQLGENQDIDQLYAKQISAGEPLNPNDQTSVDYTENVIQLSGTRLIDGVVTYSSNGDGTVNVYNVPKRWDGKNPAGAEIYEKIIGNTKQVYIDPGDDEKVIELIQVLKID